MLYSHSCIKCKTLYRDDDPDAYLCDTCKEARKSIVKELDKKFDTREKVNRPLSNLQAYDASPKIRGFIDAKYLI